jgi:putative transposase
MDCLEFNLQLCIQKWDKQYPSISKSWRSHWLNLIPFFAFLPEIRRVIYTTNAIESMNSSLRKVITSQQIFPSDETAFKLVYLATGNKSQQWTMPIKDGKPALNRFHPLRGWSPPLASRLYTKCLTVWRSPLSFPTTVN